MPNREELFTLIKEGDAEVLRSRLPEMDLAVTDDVGVTPLMAACILHPDDPVLVTALLEAGATVEGCSGGEDFNVLAHACANDAVPEVVDALIAAGADCAALTRIGANLASIAAAANTHPEVLARLLDAGVDPRKLDADRWNALHYAANRNRNPEIASLLARAGVDLDLPIPDGRTALMLAVLSNNLPMVERLIDLGARIDLRARGQMTLLMLAAMADPDRDLCLLLLACGCRAGDCDDEGQNALHFAAARNANPVALATLVAAGADCRAASYLGATPLMVAASKNQDPGIIEALLRLGSDIHQADSRGSTALVYAVRADQKPEIIEKLLANGAQPGRQNPDGANILHFAAANCTKPAVLDRLLDLVDPALVNGRTDQGTTPLMFAVCRPDGAWLVAQLLAEGADPDLDDSDGRTALIHAAANGACPAAIDLLLDAGADPRKVDANRLNAWDHGRRIKALWYSPQLERLRPPSRTEESAGITGGPDQEVAAETASGPGSAAVRQRAPMPSIEVNHTPSSIIVPVVVLAVIILGSLGEFVFKRLFN